MKTGDRIKLFRLVRKETDGCGKANEKAVVCQMRTVAGIYPHVVLLVNRHGTRECFSRWYLRRHAHAPERVERNGMMVWEWGDYSAGQQNT